MFDSDSQLLRRFAEEKSDVAFGELVQRHSRLVYGVALRQLNGDSHLARDAVQAVFIDLSRKAPRLLHLDSVASWLQVSTRYAASKLARAERARERWRLNAAAICEAGAGRDPVLDWAAMGPLVDQLVQRLEKGDREALLMRFFDGQPYGQIAATLRISEEAARKRVARAIEKLRLLLRRRGIPAGAGGLAAALESQASVELPGGFAAAVAKAALSYPTPPTFVGGGGLFMSAKLKLTITAAAVVAISGLGVVVWRKTMAARAQHDMAISMAALLHPANRPAAHFPPAAHAAVPKPTASGFQLVDAFADSDRSSPDGAIGHLYWAMNHRQIKDIEEGVVFSDSDHSAFRTIFDGLADAAKAVYGSPERMAVAVWATAATRTVSEYRVDATQPQQDGDVQVQFSIQGARGIRHYGYLVRSFPDGWKLMLPPMVRNEEQIAFYRDIAAKLAIAAGSP